ncbi:MAG TPA: hypothetical protein VGT78_05360 [Rhizomicrobium sp.]|nr:hypothetical protein [Rhizomicrobium sp.]
MSGKQRILISGSGIGGPALAYWLLRYGFEPTLIEHALAFREGGYMIDVWGTGYDLVERYGLLEATRAHAYAFDRLKFVNARGHAVSGFGSAVFQRALAGRFFSIPRGDLARTLHDTVAGKVETFYRTSIKELKGDANGVTILLTSGESRYFDIVIGADGLHSRVRELVFGTETFVRKISRLLCRFLHRPGLSPSR